MPPTWPRKPDRRDPEFRRFADRINYAFHVAVFCATNSGLWFFYHLYRSSGSWAVWTTGVWTLILLAHTIYVFAIANYSESAQG
jgi:hypothetical protein